MPALETGTQLGPYEILSPIGAGGMGEVYRAKDIRLDREVAIKVLPEKTSNDPLTLSRFEREARAVAALSHPNILSIHHIGKEKNIVYVVLELLEGETLRDHIRGSPIPWRSAVEIGMAITDGLAAAHNKGIIHRDLKPENIFLTSDGLVKNSRFRPRTYRTGFDRSKRRRNTDTYPAHSSRRSDGYDSLYVTRTGARPQDRCA